MLDAQALASQLNLPPEATVVVIATLPVFELRGSIPVAMGYFSMPAGKAVALSIFGNLVPVVPLLLLLDPVSEALRKRLKIFEKFFTWLFGRTRRNHTERFEKYGALALVPIVAVPLPMTGAWTGCAAAFVFGVKFRYSFPAIAAGVFIAALIVTTLTAGGVSLF